MHQDERIALRLPTWLLDAVDREVDRLQRLRPSASISRSDVVREVLTRALVPLPDRPQDAAADPGP